MEIGIPLPCLRILRITKLNPCGKCIGFRVTIHGTFSDHWAFKHQRADTTAAGPSGSAV